jgi:hypothetical protein
MKYISIDSGKWEDVNRTYRVLQYEQRDNSSAVDLKLELEDGSILYRTVANHHINWIFNWNTDY